MAIRMLVVNASKDAWLLGKRVSVDTRDLPDHMNIPH